MTTENQSYDWWIDGYYSTYVLSVGSSKVIQIASPPLQLGLWNVMAMVKVGNNISLFHDSDYIASYVDDGEIGEVHSVIDVAPWQGTTEYDYKLLDAAPSMNWQRTFGGGASDTGYAMVTTDDGGFAALGVTKSFCIGQYDASLVRGDGEGNELWNRTVRHWATGPIHFQRSGKQDEFPPVHFLQHRRSVVTIIDHPRHSIIAMTRMWMVDPKMMCRQHLLGEHAELHMIAANIDKGRSIEGYILINAIEPKSVRRRHDELADEMLSRGIRHNSPLDFSTGRYPEVEVDRNESLSMLLGRCPRCAERFATIHVGH